MSPQPARQDGTLIDTSVVLASLDPDEAHHLACDQVLARAGIGFTHTRWPRLFRS